MLGHLTDRHTPVQGQPVSKYSTSEIGGGQEIAFLDPPDAPVRAS
jgi:hypothetical protein